jgi:hypothetical protein
VVEREIARVGLHGGYVVARLVCGHLARCAPTEWVVGRTTMECPTCHRETLAELERMWETPAQREGPWSTPLLDEDLVRLQLHALSHWTTRFVQWLARTGRLNEWDATPLPVDELLARLSDDDGGAAVSSREAREEARLRFARWLRERGRLNEGLEER